MTSTDLFTFRDQQVRVTTIDGEPWFVLADLARVLDLSNPTMVARSLPDDDLSTTEVIDSMGRTQNATITNEPGMYRMIFQSRKIEALDFQRWVTHEVLPSIRRTGQFGSQVPTSLAEALELAAIEARKIEALEAKAALDAPKVEAYDALMDADGFYTMDAAAKILGMGRVTLYRRLRDLSIIQAGSTLPYQRHMHHFVLTAGSWTDSKGNIHPTQTTRVRPAGLDYLRRRLNTGTEVAS